MDDPIQPKTGIENYHGYKLLKHHEIATRMHLHE